MRFGHVDSSVFIKCLQIRTMAISSEHRNTVLSTQRKLKTNNHNVVAQINK